METEPRPNAGSLMLQGVTSLVRRPFSVLFVLSLLVSGVSASLSEATDPNASFVSTLILAVISLYLQIAIVAATAASDPAHSADVWLRKAFTRRVFWRYLGAALLAYLIVAIGGLLLLVGALVMGAIVGLAPQAAVLERAGPVEALRISTERSRGSRWLVGTVFAVLFLIPNGLLFIITRVAYLEDTSTITGASLWSNLLITALTTAGTIAMTRTYVALTPQPATAEPAGETET